MARLQRKKKPSVKKKKKQNAQENSSGLSTNVSAETKTELSANSVKTTKIKPYPSRQSSLTRTKAEPGKIKGYIDKGLQFLREVKIELKKVVWPTRKQTIGSTVVVLILTIIVALFLGLIDMGLSGIIRMVLK
ncbi:MAG: preprotein translocase subunit SecE [Desulfobacterales bacterium]|jgi:preprotein translocase subunit SecE|nr:preprotein translocase subunit SecE [Desulfobacterales bacterium]